MLITIFSRPGGQFLINYLVLELTAIFYFLLAGNMVLMHLKETFPLMIIWVQCIIKFSYFHLYSEWESCSKNIILYRNLFTFIFIALSTEVYKWKE